MRIRHLAPASIFAALALAACADSPVSPVSQSVIADAKGSSTPSTSTPSSTARIRIYANLLPPAGAPFSNAKGKGSWDSRNSNTKRELELEIEHLPVGTSVEFFVGGVSVGTKTTDALGKAEIEFSTELGQSVPTSVSGLAIEIRNAAGAVLVAGSFPTA